jgi:UDP-GlcNAc:undecaprenyl-phosphate/decaprenyl-phosphate GlcNAc-1-phosphate transferase
VEWGVPMLLIVTCFLPVEVPRYFSVFAAVLLGVLFLLSLFRKDWIAWAILVSLYFFIPVLIYLSDTSPWLPAPWRTVYHLSLLVLVLAALATLRLTKRQKGFKLTPMDFLVLFVPIALLALPEIRTQYSLMVMKAVVLFFCYEIVIGELRGKIGTLAVVTVTAYLIVVFRGLGG